MNSLATVLPWFSHHPLFSAAVIFGGSALAVGLYTYVRDYKMLPNQEQTENESQVSLAGLAGAEEKSMLSQIVWIGLLIVIPAFIVRYLWERTRKPLQPMTAPSIGRFLRRYARQAALEHRRVWIRYRVPNGQVIESTLDIYHTTWGGHISAWCRPQNSRGTFRRDRILAWQLLNEQFEQSKGMERWSRWEGWFERLREFQGTARGH